MFRCKGCGRENPKYQINCPSCGAPPVLAEGESEMLICEAEELRFRNDYISAVEIYKFLSAAGSADGERELGLVLEKGLLVPRDLEMATKYFYSAAIKGDVTSAYKYSRLAIGQQALCDFWLAYAAMME